MRELFPTIGFYFFTKVKLEERKTITDTKIADMWNGLAFPDGYGL